MSEARFAKSIGLAAMAMAAIQSACHDASESRSCTLVGCNDGASITVDLPVARQSLYGSTFTICFNSTCSSALYGPSADAGSDATPFDPQILSFSAFVGASITLVDDGDGATTGLLRLDSLLRDPDGGLQSVAVHDGDAYALKIVGADGAMIFSATKPAIYASVFPNGPDCGGACQEATITMTQ